MENLWIKREVSARIPTDAGTFQLCYYRNSRDAKEHLALVMGDVAGQQDVLVRIHSECYTGDVLGSLRCDCGPQLRRAMRLIAAEERGIIVYMRQEGRGIGLRDKLRAYNLQDEGFDTVDANLMLGHQADARDYTLAALILQDLEVASLRLMTNNPAKIEGLQQLGLDVRGRVPLQTAVTHENAEYLATKVARMRHLLTVGAPLNGQAAALAQLVQPAVRQDRPAVTLSYAQSLDGALTDQRGRPFPISSRESLHVTHQLRASHDAILIGIGAALADDPRLTVRLADGPQPQPVLLDSQRRLPLTAQLWRHPKPPWIFIAADHVPQTTPSGVVVYPTPVDENGRLSLPAVLAQLHRNGVRSVMVEGGAQVIGSFLAAQLVDRVAITIAPLFLGGLHAVAGLNGGRPFPRLANVVQQRVADDVIIFGDVQWT